MAKKKAADSSTAMVAKVDPAAVHQVYQWIVAGHTEYDIVEAISQKWPQAQARPLIVAAVMKLREAGEPDLPTLKGWCLEAKRELYRKMVEIGDFAGALAAVKEIEKSAKG